MSELMQFGMAVGIIVITVALTPFVIFYSVKVMDWLDDLDYKRRINKKDKK